MFPDFRGAPTAKPDVALRSFASIRPRFEHIRSTRDSRHMNERGISSEWGNSGHWARQEFGSRTQPIGFFARVASKLHPKATPVEIAAVLTERGLGGDSVDLDHRRTIGQDFILAQISVGRGPAAA